MVWGPKLRLIDGRGVRGSLRLLSLVTGVTIRPIFQEITLLQIEHGLEMPETRTKYPFLDMEPGDSILFRSKNQAESARVASIRFAKVHKPDWVFSLRKVENGWRLWRKA